jgi:two-component system sensor histidine kinase DesK
MSTPNSQRGQGEVNWPDLHGWGRYLLPALPLCYLTYVVIRIGDYHHGTAAATGYAIVAAFAVCWLLALRPATETDDRLFWLWFGLLAALFGATLPFARQAAFVMCVFLTILIVAKFERRSMPLVAVMALGALFVPVAIPSWHQSLADSFDTVTPVAIPIVALTVYGMVQVIKSNEALAEAQAENARLAAENERIRIARDLHDLLGHSLTTITLKAGLARQLGRSDPDRAISEIAEVEALARSSLADVRAVVSHYRDVTLTSELAAGRELLRAAGITADLPRAADDVAPDHSELFGWVLREGLTNVVRHAHASSCTVRLSSSEIEITDNGVGGTGASGAGLPGNGLRGLRERVAAAGGSVDSGPAQPGGWRLLVRLTPEGSAG